VKKNTKRILIGCGTAVGVVVLIGVALVAYFVHAFKKSLDPVTDVSRYAEIKATWPTNLVAHFPQDATDSDVLFFQPGFLQGGSSLQLKAVCPASSVANALRAYSTNAHAVFHGGGWHDHANQSNGVPTTHFFTSGNGGMDFPDDYVIIVTRAHDHNGGFSWNHGRTCGVAISTQRTTIVYWAEEW
jgi:hypothetical protein